MMNLRASLPILGKVPKGSLEQEFTCRALGRRGYSDRAGSLRKTEKEDPMRGATIHTPPIALVKARVSHQPKGCAPHPLDHHA